MMEQSTDHPYLVALSGETQGTQYVLDQKVFTLGRELTNDLYFLRDKSLSRQHARILNRQDLLWLEDMGSTNGTFFYPPEGEEQRLTMHQPVLMLENSQFRLGLTLRFEVRGTMASQDAATRLLRQRLQQMLMELYHGLSRLTPEQQSDHLKAIRALEGRLVSARSEEELAFLAAEGIYHLSERMERTALFGSPESNVAPGRAGLPPIPDDLPDPNDPRRLKTLLNAFITDIRICFPKNNHDDDGR